MHDPTTVHCHIDVLKIYYVTWNVCGLECGSAGKIPYAQKKPSR